MTNKQYMSSLSTSSTHSKSNVVVRKRFAFWANSISTLKFKKTIIKSFSRIFKSTINENSNAIAIMMFDDTITLYQILARLNRRKSKTKQTKSKYRYNAKNKSKELKQYDSKKRIRNHINATCVNYLQWICYNDRIF